MNLCLLIWEKKQISAYFYYLTFLNHIWYSTQKFVYHFSFQVTLALFLLIQVFLIISPFYDVILKEMESQKIFWTRNDVIFWYQSLFCDAIIGASCQHSDNAANIKVGIHINKKCLLYHAIFILPLILPLQCRQTLYFLDFLWSALRKKL